MLRLVLAAALMLAPPHDSFVTRSASHLELAGRPFRFGGANVEWLGLAGYGPFDPSGPRYPSHYEIDDALATAQELGARVVRAQTLGDSVGCSLCIEPALGQFNAARARDMSSSHWRAPVMPREISPAWAAIL